MTIPVLDIISNPNMSLTDRVEFALHLTDIFKLREINKTILRNDVCICGSGKKFKKCCMDIFQKHYKMRELNMYNKK